MSSPGRERNGSPTPVAHLAVSGSGWLAANVGPAGYTATGLALLTGPMRAYGYRYTEAFLSQVTSADGASGCTSALASWATQLWHSTLLVQLAKAAGAGMVIGAARGKEKVEAVARLGTDVTIDYTREDWGEQVRKVTGGKGADVVVDSVGGTIGRQGFEVAANGHGRLAVFGSSSGNGITVETRELAARGITIIGALGRMLSLTEQEMRANAAFALTEAAAGRLVVVIGQTYPLERAAEAHAALEARQTIGKVLLIP